MEVDVTVADLVHATLSYGLVESDLVDHLIKHFDSAVSLQPAGGESSNGGFLSVKLSSRNPFLFRTKFTAAGASDNVFNPYEPSYNNKFSKYKQCFCSAIRWQIQQFVA